EGAIVAYAVNELLKGALVVGPGYPAIAARLVKDGAQPIAQGALTLRLGVALYDRPFFFIPHSIIDETGASIQGEVVFDWLRDTAYDMPRSEVFGVTARGKDDQVFARDVDVESSPIVVGGPEASPVYVVTLIGEARLPPRFAAALKTLAVVDLPEVRKIVESA
ncbi:MAG: hypothetical protein ACRDGG_08355, partial [Anaerolineae bacterium]